MGKGDKKRAQSMIDTQGRIMQNTLGGANNQVSGSQNALSNLYWGQNPAANPGQAVSNDGSGTYAPSRGGQPEFGEAQFNAMFPGAKVGHEDLLAKEGELNAQGWEVLRNASGRAGKIKNKATGQIVDVVGGGGTGQNRKQWLTNGIPGTPEYNAKVAAKGQGGIVGQALGEHGDIYNRYSQFADTGGYSEADKAAIRQHAVSPIRAAYSNANREVERNKALQGGYAPGQGVLRARMAREQGQAASDATGNAEANIAQMVHQGKLAGMSGMSGMYGATPGLANMFGNQMQGAQGMQLQGAGLQNQLGLGQEQNQIAQGNMKGVPWGSILKGVGTAASFAAMSDRNMKKDIKEVSSKDVVAKLKKLKLYEWKYKGDDTTHVGPMAQDFKKVMEKGDGKTIHLADVMGISLATNKALIEEAGL